MADTVKKQYESENVFIRQHMGEYDVDDLLEQAFQKVEEVDKKGPPPKDRKVMEELIMEEAKKAGILDRVKNDDSKKIKIDSSSEDESFSRRRGRDANSESKSGKRSKSRESSRKKKEDRRRRSRSGSDARNKKRSRSRDRKRRSRSRSRSRSYDKHNRRRRSPDRSLRNRHSRSPRRPRVLDHRQSPPWRRSPPRLRLPGPERRDVMPFTARRSPPRNAKMDMSAEERDERTVFILQLSRNTRPRDLEEFFSSVGHVRDVRIITDSKTRRSKGIAYVEFWEKDAVPLAMGLNGQKLLNAPLVIQMTCAERNRAANATMGGAIGLGFSDTVGLLRICVSNLHPHITDDMLNAIFEPFGKIDRCAIVKDPAGVSKGHGFVHFRHADEGKKALEQLNGFELAGKNIRLTTVDDDDDSANTRLQADYVLDNQSLESEDRMDLSTHGRLKLMAKLAEGSDIQLPQSAMDVLAQQQQQVQQNDGIPSIATQCFMLSNMFDSNAETEGGWDLDVRDDVIEECNANGGVVHIYVDKASPQGNVYVKCPSIAIAHRSVVALHGRWFAGKIITANYVPVNSYHDLFPDARTTTAPLAPRLR